jgi:hypothetical protein
MFMKRSIIFLFIITGIILLLTGSSTWEGAAAIAPSGELPETGFFVATNSFPRNTVVDITNIENGRTTRAIVANTLNNSGLLAIVSREAAEIIGMRAGSVSRIRMVQPSDPMAYQQFTERLASGIPMVNDPVIEQRMLDDLYSRDTYVPPSIPAVPSYPSSPTPPVDLTGQRIERGYIVDEPEWGGNGKLNIVEVPGFLVEPLQPFVSPSEPYTVIASPYIAPAEPYIEIVETHTAPEVPVVETAKDPAPDPVRYVDVFEPVSKEPVVQEKPPVSVESIVPEKIIDTPVTVAEFTPERPLAETVKDVSSRIEETPSAAIVKDIPEYVHEFNTKETEKNVPVFVTVNDSHDELIKEPSGFITETVRDEVFKEIPDWSEIIEVVETPEKPVITEPVINELIKDPSDFIAETVRDEVIKGIPDWSEIAEVAETPEKSELAAVNDSHDELIKDPSDFIAETVRDEVIKELPDWSEIAEVAETPEKPVVTEPVIKEPIVIAEVPEEPAVTEPIIEEPIVIAEVPEEPVVTEPVKEEPVEIVTAPPYMLPTQPFMPVESTPRVMEPTVYDIPLSDIIPGITSTPPAESRQSAPVISEADIIPSIVPVQTTQSVIASTVIAPSQIISPPAVIIPAVSTPAQSFSARTISQLDRGQYYVQLAALPANQVENTIRQIDQRYNPVVFLDRDNLYKVLVGPLNQGESAAILQRFRSIGFSDAFVRYGN